MLNQTKSGKSKPVSRVYFYLIVIPNLKHKKPLVNIDFRSAPF